MLHRLFMPILAIPLLTLGCTGSQRGLEDAPAATVGVESDRPVLLPITGFDYAWASPDGTRVVTGAPGMALWDLLTGRKICDLAYDVPPRTDDIAAGLASPLEAAEYEESLDDMYQRVKLAVTRPLEERDRPRVEFSPDGRRFVIAANTTSTYVGTFIQLHDTGSGRMLARWAALPAGRLGDQAVDQLRWSADSRRLLCVTDDMSVVMFDVPAGRLAWQRKLLSCTEEGTSREVVPNLFGGIHTSSAGIRIPTENGRLSGEPIVHRVQSNKKYDDHIHRDDLRHVSLVDGQDIRIELGVKQEEYNPSRDVAPLVPLQSNEQRRDGYSIRLVNNHQQLIDLTSNDVLLTTADGDGLLLWLTSRHVLQTWLSTPGGQQSVRIWRLPRAE